MTYYKSRYLRYPFSLKWQKYLLKFLIRLNSSTFKKFLNQLDIWQMDHFITPQEFNKQYIKSSNKKLSVKQIEILEIFDIDHFKILQKKLNTIIGKEEPRDIFGITRKLTFSEQSELIERIAKITESFGFGTSGPLFSIVNSNKNRNRDLYERVDFKFYKTRENLFLLKLEVIPSEKFNKTVEDIANTDTIPTDIPMFFPFSDFIKSGRIIQGSKTPGFPKDDSFKLLVGDLISQIKIQYLNDFQGVYSEIKNLNPHIVFLNSPDELTYKDFRDGFGIVDTSRVNEIYYNEQLNVYLLSKARFEKNNCLYVIGDNDAFPDEYHQEKELNKYYLSNSLYPSWILINYFHHLNISVTELRKSVYKFITSKGRIKFKRQIKIQTQLSRMKIHINRIKNEFDSENTERYINSYHHDYQTFNLINNSAGKDLNYYLMIKDSLNYYINEMNKQIIEIEDYFKEISNINLVRVNMKAQNFILVLTILGLILALANINDLISLYKTFKDLILSLLK
jgi:hypothetical protein